MISLVVEDVDLEVHTEVLWDRDRRGVGEALAEVDLQYTVFPARVTCEVDGVVVIGPRRRVPLFGFLTGVARSIEALSAGRRTSLGYTESADRVDVRPLNGDDVEISTSDSDLLVRTGRLALVTALEGFLSSGRTWLVDGVPGLQLNPHIAKLTVAGGSAWTEEASSPDMSAFVRAFANFIAVGRPDRPPPAELEDWSPRLPALDSCLADHASRVREGDCRARDIPDLDGLSAEVDALRQRIEALRIGDGQYGGSVDTYRRYAGTLQVLVESLRELAGRESESGAAS